MNERPLLHLPLPLEKVRITLVQYLICSFCILISGILELFLIYFLKEPQAELFLYIIENFNDNCRYLIKAACISTIIVGLVSILNYVLGCPGRLLCCLSCLLICPFGVMAIGIGEAASISLSNEEMYTRMVKMDTYYYKHRTILFPVSHDKTLVSEFQETFHCCGMFSTRDWYVSDCKCIPPTCCRPETTKFCKTNFSGGDDSLIPLDDNSSMGFSSIEPNLWKTGCITEIQSVTAKLKKKWLILIGSSAVVHCLLSMWYLHITSVMTSLLLSPVGNVQLHIFKAHWPSKGFKVRKEYTTFARVHDKILSETDTSVESDAEMHSQ